MKVDQVLQVGDVEVDLAAREIRRGGVVTEVQPRVFDLFQYLIEHRGRVVTKTELLEALWDGHVVVPDVVSTAFYTLRRVLRDSAKNPVYIRTVHRVGYQLVAPVRARSGATNARASFPALDLRHAGFVGRQDQKVLFDDMLAGRSSAQVLFVHGLPGIGKTTLLQELVFRCRQERIEHVWLSGETAGPFVDAFIFALAAALGCDRAFGRLRERLAARPLVIFVDDVHLLHGVDGWIRQELWPALPSHVRLVLAGRLPPSARWRCDPAWHRGAHGVELPSLTLEEARAFFAARGLRSDSCEVVWRRARGHPLALTLAVEILERDGRALDAFDDADAIDTLVGWFTDRIDVTMHQRALEKACLFDEVSVRMLAAVDDRLTAEESIRWLSRLSFVERDGELLRVHALVREATIARLARRDWERFADLMEAGQRFFQDELARAPDAATRLRLLYRFLGQGRHHPALRGYYQSSDFGGGHSVQPAAPRELPSLLDIVDRHEGGRSMEIARRWLEHPGTKVWSVRGDDDVPLGFLMTLHLQAGERSAPVVADPVVASLFDRVEKGGRGAPDEEMIVHRTIISRADYQTPSAVARHLHAVMADAMLWHATHSPKVVDVFVVYGDPDLWDAVAASAGLGRLRGHEVPLGGRTFGVFHRSMRGMTADAWLDELSARMVAAIRAGASATPSS